MSCGTLTLGRWEAASGRQPTRTPATIGKGPHPRYQRHPRCPHVRGRGRTQKEDGNKTRMCTHAVTHEAHTVSWPPADGQRPQGSSGGPSPTPDAATSARAQRPCGLPYCWLVEGGIPRKFRSRCPRLGGARRGGRHVGAQPRPVVWTGWWPAQHPSPARSWPGATEPFVFFVDTLQLHTSSRGPVDSIPPSRTSNHRLSLQFESCMQPSVMGS